MRALTVVKVEPLFKAFSQFRAVVKRPQVKILILERPPQALNEYIVLDPATAIHTDAHMMRFEQISKSAGGKLKDFTFAQVLLFFVITSYSIHYTKLYE